ncbi:hypothetical protein HNY73_006072 [Argiope bruennichi]|uniref:Uncharacterized protein n=1 Tax=Argiope bruennichi TaxID=94029 RepID=A0A8T0FL98_ARGBR|nr:hypothetical protein HNY73_006072 [Argiope bruennichi]
MEPFTRQNLLQNKFSDVPKLQDMCIKALMKGLKQSMDVTKLINKNASFETLELILVTLSPDKLYRLEEEKKYLLKNTDTFWKLHCTNKFRSQVQLKKEDESWRIFYQRCCTVSEEKFKNVTASLTASAAKAKPGIIAPAFSLELSIYKTELITELGSRQKHGMHSVSPLIITFSEIIDKISNMKNELQELQDSVGRKAFIPENIVGVFYEELKLLPIILQSHYLSIPCQSSSVLKVETVKSLLTALNFLYRNLTVQQNSK